MGGNAGEIEERPSNRCQRIPLVSVIQMGAPTRTTNMTTQRFLLTILLIFAGSTGYQRVRSEEKKSEDKKTSDKLEAGQYRVKIEAIVAPPGDLAIYRVQVWTVGKKVIRLSGIGERGSLRGESEPEEKSVLHRDDSVIVFALQQHSNPKLRGEQLELEQRFMGPKGRGGIRIRSSVELKTDLSAVIEISDGTYTVKLGEKVEIGKIQGQAIFVSAEDLRKK